MIKQIIKSTLLVLVGIFLGFLIRDFQANSDDIKFEELSLALAQSQNKLSILEQRSEFDILYRKNLISKLSSYRIKTNLLNEKSVNSDRKYTVLEKQLDEQKKQLIVQKNTMKLTMTCTIKDFC